MREIRLYGSEGGGTEANRSFLPLSSATLRVGRAAVATPSGRRASRTEFLRRAWERV